MPRIFSDPNPPVWAGVVVRLADGTIYAAHGAHIPEPEEIEPTRKAIEA